MSERYVNKLNDMKVVLFEGLYRRNLLEAELHCESKSKTNLLFDNLKIGLSVWVSDFVAKCRRAKNCSQVSRKSNKFLHIAYFRKKTHGIYHDIWQIQEFSTWWRYVNIWCIALNPRSFEGILKTNVWHWHCCFKVTLRSRQYPNRVFLWSQHNLSITCLGSSHFGEAYVRPGFQVR